MAAILKDSLISVMVSARFTPTMACRSPHLGFLGVPVSVCAVATCISSITRHYHGSITNRIIANELADFLWLPFRLVCGTFASFQSEP